MVYTTKYTKGAKPEQKRVGKFAKGGPVRGTNIPASRIYGKEDLKRLEEQRGREEYDRDAMNRLAKQAAEEDE